jgi:GT2 family glycosyltransferase
MTVRALDVSVVIATYNRPSLLARLLDDLDAQVLAGTFEVIVIDDGSAEPFADTDPHPYPLTVVAQANAGAGAARDLGIRRAHGAVVVVVDDDMRVGPDFLAQHLRHHRAGATVVLGAIASATDGQRRPLFDRFHHSTLIDHPVQMNVSGDRLCTGNCSFRRLDYLAVGGFDLTLPACEDRDLGLRLEAADARLVMAPDAVVHHHSDHEHVGTWRARSRRWGWSDTLIAARPGGPAPDLPWRLRGDVPAPVRPLLTLAVRAPWLVRPFGALAYRLGGVLAVLRLEPLAVRAAALCFCADYYAGVAAGQRALAAGEVAAPPPTRSSDPVQQETG